MTRHVLLAVVLLVATLVLPSRVAAASDGRLRLEASVNGTAIGSATSAPPLRIDPADAVLISLRVENAGPAAVDVAIVNFSGEVIGLTFFNYETSVRLSVPPGHTGALDFPLDLTGLRGQATGLMPGSITLLDRSRNPIARADAIVDVKGSLRSVYGLFGLAIALATILVLVALLLAVARHQLPPNRWRRAARFIPLGVGIGLTIIFSVSAAGVLVPTATHWVPMLLVVVMAVLGIGFLSPAPGLEMGQAAAAVHGEAPAVQDEEAAGVHEQGLLGTAVPRPDRSASVPTPRLSAGPSTPRSKPGASIARPPSTRRRPPS